MPDQAEQLDRLKTALADRYQIERELGRGGMATVYLAEDLKHHRPVAVKVLRPELAAAIGPERFVREIHLTASLDHPHILPLLDSGEADGFLFYVMPYVEGESLRDRLNRETPLPIDEAIQITREVADALDFAHRHDVIHRDIKPENVLLGAGHARVADFGIARAIGAAGAERLTETGIAVGTPAYMSPEQASGDHRIDGRTDIYALGCVLYEMLSGDAPYMASTPQAVLAKKLSEPTPRISVVRETVPAAVEAALTKVLAKTPVDRYTTAKQFAQALTMPGNGIAPAPSAPTAAYEEPRRAEAVGAVNLRWFASRLGRPRLAVPAALVVLASAFFGVRFVQHRAEVRWAREVALPEIERLMGENDAWRNLVPPYRLAEQAEAILGNDPELAELFSQIALEIDVQTDPAGASVFLKEYGDPDGEWTYLGVSPLEKIRVPIGIFRWRIEKEGYETVLAAASTWNVSTSGDKPGIPVPYDLVRTLDQEGSVPPGMVRVQGTETAIGTHQPGVQGVRRRRRVQEQGVLEASICDGWTGADVGRGHDGVRGPVGPARSLYLARGRLSAGPGRVSGHGGELVRGGGVCGVCREEPTDERPLERGTRSLHPDDSVAAARRLRHSGPLQQLWAPRSRSSREPPGFHGVRGLRHGGKRERMVLERDLARKTHQGRRLERQHLRVQNSSAVATHGSFRQERVPVGCLSQP